MDLTALWDPQTIVYVILSVIVTLIILGLLSATNRRLGMLASEVESLRREMKLVDEGVKSVAQHLQASSGTQPKQFKRGDRPSELGAKQAEEEDRSRAVG